MSLSISKDQSGNCNKKFKAVLDSLNAEMITTQGDDIVFCLYDNRMSKIKLDSIFGDCLLKFHYARIPIKIHKIDDYHLGGTLPDFNGYIKFIRCELNVTFNKKNKQFVFINQ